MISLLLGCGIAYVVNIPMVFYEKHFIRICKWSSIRRYRRSFCMFLSFLTLILIGAVLWQLIFPQVVSCGHVIYKRFPQIMEVVYDWLEERFHIGDYLSENMEGWLHGPIQWQKLITKIPEMLRSLKSILQKMGSVLLTLLPAIVFSMYLLAGKERLEISFRRLGERFLPKKPWMFIRHVLTALNHAFRSFIVGQCTEAVILGILCTIGMWIFQLPYAIMIGCLVGVTALIPVAGAYIGAGVGALMILTVSPLKTVVFLVFLVVLQQIEGNLIYPRVVGSSIGLPGLWVFAAVIAGGAAFGVVGILFAVPLTAAFYQLLKEAVEKPKKS